jgi:GWxTD domain-containing protein
VAIPGIVAIFTVPERFVMRGIRFGSALLLLSGWVCLPASTEAIGAAGHETASDWSRSAAAVFLTTAERRQWKSLRTDAARTQFEIDYWRRRDPEPTTPRNEFTELVEARIAEADRQFSTSKQRGADTARGRNQLRDRQCASRQPAESGKVRTASRGGRTGQYPSAADQPLNTLCALITRAALLSATALRGHDYWR